MQIDDYIIRRQGTNKAATDIARQVFDGKIIIFSGLDELDALLDQARRHCETAFDNSRPDLIVGLSKENEFLEKAEKLDRAFARAPETAQLFNALFAGIGLPLETLYIDRWRLRCNPSDHDFLSDKVRHVPPHRDNWGSHIHQQVNWWAPLYEIEAQQSLLFYPDHWANPVDNDSATWSLEELKSRRQKGDAGSYPTLPTARGDLSHQGTALVIRPGEIACFSGAHLHASAENRSGRCRFNLETRSINRIDMENGLAAPNIDGPSRHEPNLHWFRHCLTGTNLADDCRSPALA